METQASQSNDHAADESSQILHDALSLARKLKWESRGSALMLFLSLALLWGFWAHETSRERETLDELYTLKTKEEKFSRELLAKDTHLGELRTELEEVRRQLHEAKTMLSDFEKTKDELAKKSEEAAEYTQKAAELENALAVMKNLQEEQASIRQAIDSSLSTQLRIEANKEIAVILSSDQDALKKTLELQSGLKAAGFEVRTRLIEEDIKGPDEITVRHSGALVTETTLAKVAGFVKGQTAVEPQITDLSLNIGERAYIEVWLPNSKKIGTTKARNSFASRIVITDRE